MRTAAIAVVVVALVVLGGLGVSTFVTGRDSASVSSGAGPGAARSGSDGLGDAADVGVEGNIVLLHADAADGDALRALAADVAGPPSPELEQAGQAIIVRRDPQAGGVVAVSATRLLRAQGAGDPQLRAFVEAWLGHAESS